jgi:hypothetical protein
VSDDVLFDSVAHNHTNGELRHTPVVQVPTFTGRQHVVGDHDIESIVAFDVNFERFLETLLGHIDVVQILEHDSSQKAHGRLQLVV